MKTIIRNILICTTIVIFTASCGNDWLDLYPTNRIETNIAIRTVADARAAMNGVYWQIQRSTYYGGRMIWHGDIKGDDMRTWGASSTRSGVTYRYDATPQTVNSALWNQPYTVIRNANNILALVDNLEFSALLSTEAQEAERSNIKGEALMARALAHFDICRVFGVPYMKDNGASLGAAIVLTSLAGNAKPARSTVAQTYAQVIADLRAAIPLLSDSRPATQGRFNRWSAKLLLSRVYLYMGDNANALREAEECIAGAEAAGFALYTNANYLQQWQTKFSTESLFEIVNISGQNTGSDGVPNWSAANAANAVHELGITRTFYDLLASDPDDVRLRLLRVGFNYPNAFPGFILKYTNSTVAIESNVTIFRLSETYLNSI